MSATHDGMPPPVALVSLAALARAVFDAAAVSIAVVDGEELRYVAADGAGAAAIVGVQLPLGRGIAGWVASTQQPLSIDDLGTDPRHERGIAESAGYVPTAMTTVPMVADGRTVGVVQVLDPGTPPHRADFGVLDAVARHAAVLVGTQRATPAGATALAEATTRLAALDPVGRTAAAAALQVLADALAPRP